MKFMRQHTFHVSNGGADAMPVGGNTTYYTDAINIEKANNFAIIYKGAKDAGSLDLTIEMEQSFELPTAEYASDADYVEGADVNDVETNLSTTTRKHKAVSPNTLKYIRLKIAGGAGNHATATLEATLSMQEEN